MASVPLPSGSNTGSKFLTTLQKKKDIDSPSFQHLLADGLLIYVADAVSPSIRYLWSRQTELKVFCFDETF